MFTLFTSYDEKAEKAVRELIEENGPVRAKDRIVDLLEYMKEVSVSDNAKITAASLEAVQFGSSIYTQPRILHDYEAIVACRYIIKGDLVLVMNSGDRINFTKHTKDLIAWVDRLAYEA